jgi:hypothetical protein
MERNAPELSRSVVPPGGFWYEQALADGSVTRISGGSLDQVLELVLAYRQQNGMILGAGVEALPEAVSRDYHQWACGKWPWLCTGVREGPTATVEASGGVRGFELLVLRMQRWVDGLRRGPIEWVDAKRALERANICLGCPMNVLWETNCGSCNQNLVLSSAAVRGVRRTGMEGGLKGCRVYGTLQEVAVWVQDPGGEGAKYQVPSFCWRASAG